MSDVLCDISAFRFYRIPPQVLLLLPMIPAVELDPNRAQFVSHPLISDVIGVPVHTLVDRKGGASAGPRIVKHAWTGELPFGSIQSTFLGIKVSSPLLTLLTMASSVSETKLLMALYEMCGTFAVFEPSDFIEDLLAAANEQHLLDDIDGWERCVDDRGVPTNLWKRPPLVEMRDLERFIAECAGRKGVKRLARAAAAMTGVAASPFEAQASILFGLSRARGGEGLALQNNVDIQLNRDAKRVSGTNKRVADILLTSEDGERSVIVECQGEAFHSSDSKIKSDSDRTTALQSMGYEVVLLTYSQINDPESYEIVTSLISSKLGIVRRPKTKRQLERQKSVRFDVFDDWESMI